MAYRTAWTKRIQRFAIVAAIFVYTLMATAEASADDVIVPIAAEVSNVEGGNNPAYQPEFAIDGSEMTPGGFTGTYPIDQTKGALVTLSSTAYNAEPWSLPGGAGHYNAGFDWVAGSPSTPYNVGGYQWIAWDLGSAYNIGSFHLWNGNQQGPGRMVSSAEMYLISSLPNYGDPLPSGTLVWNGVVTAATQLPTYTGTDYNLNAPTTGRYFMLKVTGSTGGDNGYVSISEIRFVKAPPMGVYGLDGNWITNGTMSASTNNGTDFAGVIIGNSLTHTFTITNTSAADINLTGVPLVAVTGDTNFSVAVQPSTPVAPGSSTTFQVTFSPTAPAEVKTATVSITNDTPATPYSFSIRGTATSVPPPTKLAYTAVPSIGTSGIPFSVTVQAQDTDGNPSCPVSSTTITLTNATGAGFMSGVLTGVIGTETNSVTIATPVYSKADVMTLRATATAGDSLTNVTSSGIAFQAGAAAKLEFTTQPGGGTAETAWAIQPVVQVQDANGNAATTDVSTVTVAIHSNAGGGTLSGTLTEAAVAGVADFSANGLKINKSGVGYTLIATDGSLASATSGVFNITAGAVDAGSSTVSSSPTEVQADGIAAATITVTLRDVYGNPVAGKAVALASSRGAADTITTNSGTTSASGTAIFSARSLTLGAADFTATDETDALPISPSMASVGFVPVTVIQPVAATAQFEDQGPTGPYNATRTITGAEMTPGGAGAFPVDESSGAVVTLASTCRADEPWSAHPDQYAIGYQWDTYVPSNFQTTPIWIAWDLGATNTIDAFHLWNGNATPGRYVYSADMYAIDSLPANGDALPALGALVWSGNNMEAPPNLNTYTGTNCSLTTPTSSRYFLMNITGAGAGGTGNYADINEIRFTKLSSIFVAGTNNAIIAFADVTPSVADGTDFGGVVLYRSLTHTFTIGNTGLDPIALTNVPMVYVVGDGDFSVMSQPATNSIDPGGSTTFQIRLSPNGAAGQIKTARVFIYNSSPQLSPYTFDIKGTATGGTVLIIR